MDAHAFAAKLTRRQMGEVAYTIAEVPGATAAALLALPSGKRVFASYDGGEAEQTRLLPDGDGGHYLLLSVEHQQAYGLRHGDQVHVQLLPDDSDYGMPLPAEWAECLAGDGELDRAFHALTPGRQRRILYVVGAPKTAATRERKAAGCAAYLREVGAAGFDYAGLVAWLKGR